MLEPLAIPAINRLLRANSWALERLRPYAGRTALLSCPPVSLRLAVLDTGELAPAARDAPADVTIVSTPGVLLRLAARDESAWNAASVTGDVEFAGTIDYLRRNLTWDYEEDLSRIFGDIAAHRLAGGLRELDAFARKTLLNLGQSFAEYATYERPTLASRPAVDAFCREVDEVRDHAARLEKRIELVSRTLGGDGERR